MDDLPNKIRDVPGIMAEVNLHEENGLYFIEIITPPYSVPISLSRQLLRPQRLDQAGIKGQCADGISAAKNPAKSGMMSSNRERRLLMLMRRPLKQFKADAAKAGRLPTDDSALSLAAILVKVRLTEKGQLKRAAIVIFGKDPGRFYPNQIIKIGRFGLPISDCIIIASIAS